MSEEPAKPERSRTLRISIRVGETVAVLGLLFGVATFLIGRQDKAEEAKKAQVAQVRASTLVLKGAVEDDGARVTLIPADPGQVIESQRYIFPRAVREAAREIGAGQPQVDRAWIEDGLKREAKALRQAGGELTGDSDVPVVVVTRYTDDGETRTDQTLYRVGYRLKPGLLGRSEVELLGVSRIGRAKAGDLQAQADALWAQGRPAPN